MFRFVICLLLTLEAQKTDAALVNSVKTTLSLCSDIVEAVGDFLSIFETKKRRRMDNLGQAVTKKLKTCRSIIELVDGFRKKHFSPTSPTKSPTSPTKSPTEKVLKMPISLKAEEIRFLRKMLIGATKKLGDTLYVASKDGDSATVFHQKCDNKGPTVVIVESTTGGVFGGYTDANWEGRGWRYSSRSFLFRLRPKDMRKYAIRTPKYAIYRHSAYGPTFGSGHDLYIANRAMSAGSSTRGKDYKIPTTKKLGLNGGIRSFKVKDYVVFKAMNL